MREWIWPFGRIAQANGRARESVQLYFFSRRTVSSGEIHPSWLHAHTHLHPSLSLGASPSLAHGYSSVDAYVAILAYNSWHEILCVRCIFSSYMARK